jgi:hypothetical protein
MFECVYSRNVQCVCVCVCVCIYDLENCDCLSSSRRASVTPVGSE